MKQQRKKCFLAAVLFGVLVCTGCGAVKEGISGFLSGNAGNTASSDGDALIYYQKADAVYRVDLREGEAAAPEKILSYNADEELSQDIGNGQDFYMAEDGSYAAFMVYAKEEDNTYKRLYLTENEPGKPATLLSDRVEEAAMYGNTLLYQKTGTDPSEGTEVLYAYTKKDGSFVVSQNAEFPYLADGSRILFFLHYYEDYYGRDTRSDLYYADVASKAACKPKLLMEDIAWIEEYAPDFSKIYAMKQEPLLEAAEPEETETEDSEEDREYNSLYLIEDFEEAKLLKQLHWYDGEVLGINVRDGSFYYTEVREEKAEEEKENKAENNDSPEDGSGAGADSAAEDFESTEELFDEAYETGGFDLEQAVTDLYYHGADGNDRLLQENINFDREMLDAGLIRFCKAEEAGGGRTIDYLARDGKISEVKGLPYREFWFSGLYDEEAGTYFAVYSTEKNLSEEEGTAPKTENWLLDLFGASKEPVMEYMLCEVDTSAAHLGEMRFVDVDDNDITIVAVRGDDVYYTKPMLGEDGIYDYEEDGNSICLNGSVLADDYAYSSFMDISYQKWERERKQKQKTAAEMRAETAGEEKASGKTKTGGSGEAKEKEAEAAAGSVGEIAFMTCYPERSYEHLDRSYDDMGALYRMTEERTAEKLSDDVACAQFLESGTIMLKDYQNPKMHGELVFAKDGEEVLLDTEVEAIFFRRDKTIISPNYLMLTKDEPQEESEEDWALDWDEETEDVLGDLDWLFGNVYDDDMTEEEIAAAKEAGGLYIEDQVYHSPGDLYSLKLLEGREWQVQELSALGSDTVYIRDADASDNMAINMRVLEERIDTEADADTLTDIEDKLTIFPENELISCENIRLDDTPALRVEFQDVEFGIDGYYISYLINDAEHRTHCISITWLEEDEELKTEMQEIAESFRWSEAVQTLV